MTKLELIDALGKEAGISKNEASQVVNLFFGEISNALASNGRVEIRGLCSFFVKQYEAYTGRNPKTGNPQEWHLKSCRFLNAAKS